MENIRPEIREPISIRIEIHVGFEFVYKDVVFLYVIAVVFVFDDDVVPIVDDGRPSVLA
jgi:hypothetical protein